MKCRQCGAELVAGAMFCRVCGAKAETENRVKFCPNCGNEIVSGASFCRKCGYDILNGEYNDNNKDEDEDEIEEFPQKKRSIKDKLIGTWNGLDWAMQTGMIFCGIIVYLFVLALLANNWTAVGISIGQLAAIGTLLLIHFGKVRPKKETARYVFVAAVAILGVLYLNAFYVTV